MRRKKERSKQGQTNKQGKATQHTQGSHMHMVKLPLRINGDVIILGYSGLV